MKKLQMTLLTMCGIALVALPLTAATEKIGGYTWTYRINGDTAEIYGRYSTNNRYIPCVSPSPTGVVVIPSTLGNKSVTCIGDYAFIGCGELSNVTIPNSVTNIGASAFYSSGLTSLTIPDSVTSIGDSAFYACHYLTRVTIPDSVTSIGDMAFEDCRESLFDTTTVFGVKLVDGWVVDHTAYFPGDLNLTGIRGIGDCAFYACDGLTSVTIGNGITSIGESAFSDCSELANVTIGDGVTSIRGHAFEWCRNIGTVILPSSITNIGEAAFIGCNSLSVVSVPNIETWFGITFADKYSNPLHNPYCLLTVDGKDIVDLTIPGGVTRVNDNAFSGYSWLKSVILSDATTSIGIGAFDSCTQLTNITFSESLANIEAGAFRDCYGLTSRLCKIPVCRERLTA